MNQFAPRLRQWVRPLQHTPFHPQWFVFRDVKRTRDWIRANARGWVLDIGCADGWAKESLAPECDYVGLDYPTTARELYGTKPGVFADGARLPFVDGAFDTILLLEVIEHVVDAEGMLSEIGRVLKPGGKLLLSVPFLYPLHDAPHDYRRYTAPGLVQVLRKAGLNPGEPEPRNAGFEVVGLLGAIACAEGLLASLKSRRWRLLCAPLLVLAIPFLNVFGWLLSFIGGDRLLASGYAVEACKP